MAKLRAMQPRPPAFHAALVTVLLLCGLSRAASAEDLALPDLAGKVDHLVQALSLIGTPYRMGGRDPKSGLDCSGLVGYVYAQTKAVDLPRSAAEISRQGEAVDKEQLQPGDLVFFNTLRKPFSHVGIYKGEGKFVHASSSRTGRVLVSDMTQPYWVKRFNGARRLLP